MAKEDTPFLFRWFFPNGGDRRNAQVILMNAEGEPYTAYKFETKFDPNVPIEAQTPRTHIYALSPPRASYSPTNSHSTLVPPPNDYLSSDSSPPQKPSKLTFTQSKKEIATVKWEKDFYATFVKFNHWPGEDIVAYVQQDANGVAGANGTLLVNGSAKKGGARHDDDEEEEDGKEVKRIQKTFLLRHAVMKEESALVKAASADKCLRFLVDGWRECKWKFSKSTGDLVVIGREDATTENEHLLRTRRDARASLILNFRQALLGKALRGITGE
ncbi:uncharacterized protein EI90DRAFT_3016910 [Cantharellus anzutake]|uniref:uncharacterized protein n=1 Tax=Cantharellus anzutake TaxID=1750568 RepID=UPI001903F585|nr:uncharacterized protein EI90DRAFT_3016910 [Cantharellus anzutake]KAF8330182.1 hypothetical protein EI90DRAFT_3016910 [Cantharellus anzutake]